MRKPAVFLGILLIVVPVGLQAQTDHEFDNGSRIRLPTLSDVQVSNMAMLAKVWGFLKYHHPAVTSGSRQWDYDLFRIMPAVLAAADSSSANSVIADWVTSLGAVPGCDPCASLDPSDLYLPPNVDWIKDATLLGGDLSLALQAIYLNRPSSPTTFYVSPAPGLSSLQFNNELGYGNISAPDTGFQLLAVFRYWNMVQYFYPDRDVMSGDPTTAGAYWDGVLKESIPLVGLAQDNVTYQRELMKLTAKLNDTHATLPGSLAVRPPVGSCQLAVQLRFVEGQPVVYKYFSPTSGLASGLMIGDVIQQLDGVPVADLIQQWTPYYAGSNDAGRHRDMQRYMTRGACGPANVVIQRGDSTLNLTSARVLQSSLGPPTDPTHDLPGNAFQMLASDIAYLKISSVVAANSASYIRSAAGTKGLIIDIRNYPTDYSIYTLGQLLVSDPTDFDRYTVGDVSNPSAMHWLLPEMLIPQEPHYSGKVIILVDELTLSSAEYHAMAFRSAPGAIVIGSMTAGADGNVMTAMLPGGFFSYVTGLGVFYPDGRPTQRVGIVPDIVVNQSIEAIREGRDELIEEAMRQIYGPPSIGTISYSVADHGVASSTGSGISSGVSVGYGVIQSNDGGSPSALAIFGLTQNGVLVSEASVPASSLIKNGRTYAEINDSVDTGMAIANPSTNAVTISFYFSDSSGSFGAGTATIPAKGQISAFLDQAPFNGKSGLNGTFTFAASAPVAVIALSGMTNERGEFLITTLPVADLNATSGSAALMFPHFAEGGGWTTQIVLANPTDSTLTGKLQFLDPAGTGVNNLAYIIAPRSSQKLLAPGTGVTTAVGSVRVLPSSGIAAPFGVAIFSFRDNGITVSEAGVPAIPVGNAFRLYAEASADAASIQTGVAVTNTSTSSAVVTLALFNSDGAPTGLTGALTLPANGQSASFLNQISGLSSMPESFQGTLRVSSSAPISLIGLRGRTNKRGDFLVTTTPPVSETDQPQPTPLYFPHLAVGGGYTTQFIMFNGQAGQTSTGVLSLFAQAGQVLNVILQ